MSDIIKRMLSNIPVDDSDRVPVSIFGSAGNSAIVDLTTNGLVVHNEFHSMIHRGVAFEVEAEITATTFYEFITTGTKDIHIVPLLISDTVDCSFQLFAKGENPSDGTAVASYNKKIGGGTAEWTVKSDTTHTPGDAISSLHHVYASAVNRNNSVDRNNEYDIPASSSGFLVKITTTGKCAIHFMWYEI